MIIVDGYNVIYKWKSLSKFLSLREKTPDLSPGMRARSGCRPVGAPYNIELARSRLINILANYQGYIGEEVIIVFDSSIRDNVNHSEETEKNISVIYAPSNQGADIFIERMVHSCAKQKDITVVTGDTLERIAVNRAGAKTISPEKFEEEVVKVCGSIGKGKII